MASIIAKLFDMGYFTDELMTRLAVELDLSQLEVAAIIDLALAQVNS